ncbi:MAG: TlpA family protein disulfide reductase [Planctomyces sp.]|nr:TlpA family protein disulfide reductase [Planctomyces sp.]
MPHRAAAGIRGLCCLWIAGCLCSCSSQETPAKAAGSSSSVSSNSETSAKPFVPPAVSIAHPEVKSAALDVAASDGADDDDDDAPLNPTAIATPSKGTPEWLIHEIARLNTAPLDRIQQPVAGKPDEFVEVQLNPAQIAAEQARRAQLVIDFALEACAKTRGDEARQPLFNNAVHYLAAARTTLALSGDTDQARLLSDEAETLHRLDAKSFAAVESQLKLVEMLQKLAERSGRSDPQWGQAAARHARLFASRFPQEASRAALSLLSAARACEAGGQFEEAGRCFAILARDFGSTPFAEQAAGSLRRYALVGKTLEEFGGPTIDGAFLSIDQFRGQPVLIAFWSAGSAGFREDVSLLQEAVDAFGEKPLTILGVNVDAEESIVDSALEQIDLPWRTIFFSNIEQRGWRSPLARFYGVATVPQYWVVDDRGVVVAAPATAEQAAQKLKGLAKP